MSYYKVELSETEKACGVTLADVAHWLPLGLFLDHGTAFALPDSVGPALGVAVARTAFRAPVTYKGRAVGLNIYRKA